LQDKDRVPVEDVLVEIRQAETMTRTARDIPEATMDALATVVSNNREGTMGPTRPWLGSLRSG